MLGYVCGEIAETGEGTVTVDSAGIGYELSVSSFTLSACRVGAKTKLYTYLQVKEDGLTLYGFADKSEKSMFLRLISVSGIGCKAAMSILSGINTDALAAAIYSGDLKTLTKIKGLGKKTAERLVLELKEKISLQASSSELSSSYVNGTVFTKEMNDALTVLVSLGKNRENAEELVAAASKLGAATAEELINMAFRIN